MSCVACNADFHYECFYPVDGLCCCELEVIVIESTRGKNAEDMKDPISTGRKRAAIAKPITQGLVCEWAHLKYAGGGVEPIIGCNGNLATNIHHGPDKDILNNDVDTNLHRICATCHNRWHTANDKFYGIRPTPGTPFIPLVPYVNRVHDPDTKATIEEIFNSHMRWSGVKLAEITD